MGFRCGNDEQGSVVSVSETRMIRMIIVLLWTRMIIRRIEDDTMATIHNCTNISQSYPLVMILSCRLHREISKTSGIEPGRRAFRYWDLYCLPWMDHTMAISAS